MDKSVTTHKIDIRFYIHFALPNVFMMYDFNYRIQSLVGELEPHCAPMLKIFCDISRNMESDLTKTFGTPKTPVVLGSDLVEKSLTYTTYVEIQCDDVDVNKLMSIVAHLVAEVALEGVEVDIEPVDKDCPLGMMFDFAHEIQKISYERSASATSFNLFEFSTFMLGEGGRSAVDLFESSVDADMVILDPPMEIEGAGGYSARGTAYIYGDVNSPSVLVDENGLPVLVATYKYSANRPDGSELTVFDWVVTRVIMIPKMPNLEIMAHCLNTHPMQPGFGDGVFSYISPLLLVSDIPSMQHLMLMGTLLSGFVDGNGVTFIDHCLIDDDIIAELPIRDLYQYLSSVDELFSMIGDFGVDSLKEHALGFTASLESYDNNKITRH